jgi:hypothetical protein
LGFTRDGAELYAKRSAALNTAVADARETHACQQFAGEIEMLKRHNTTPGRIIKSKGVSIIDRLMRIS